MGDAFRDNLEEDVEWRIIERNRLDRKYQIDLIVLDAKKLLTLVSDFTKTIETKFEQLKKKK